MNYFKKTFSIVLIILSFSLILPTNTSAQSVDIANAAKEYGLDLVAWRVGDMVVKRITAQTVNWINSGFQGSPSYIRNPRQFFLGVADSEASRFLSTASMNQICSPFRAQVRLALVRNYLNEDSANYSCSLGTLRNNYDQFINDFDQGGWTSWFQVTTNNSNNPYGSYIETQNQLAINVGTQKQKYQDQFNAGRGFLSFERCPEGMENPSPQNNFGDCLAEKETVTPGSVIESKLNQTLGSGVERIVQSDELDEIISALLGQLLNKALGGTGLFGASNSSAGQPSYTSQLGNEQEPTPIETPPTYEIPPCPADRGYNCAPTPPPTSCQQPPTADERALAEAATNYLRDRLNAETLAMCTQVAAPASQECQDAVRAIVNDTNANYPGAAALYYPGENTIGLPFTYIVGPNTNRVSNIIGPGDTWRSTYRVFCDPNTTPPGPSDPDAWNIVGTIDPRTVNIVSADASVTGWPEATTITGGSWASYWNVDFTTKATWPQCTAFPPNGNIQYTIWLFLNINGQWYGSAFIRNWIGGVNNGGPGTPFQQLQQNWYYDSRWSPMYGHVLQPGEEIGIMVTNGNQRPTDGVQCGNGQRSNIVRIRLP